MTYSNLPRILLLTVAVLGLTSVASACEISGYKYQELGDGTPYTDHPLQGWTIYLYKSVGATEPVLLAQTTTDAAGHYNFSEKLGNLPVYPEYKGTVYGTYRVYEKMETGWTQLSPSAGYYEVTLSGGSEGIKVVQNLNFVNQRTVYCPGETFWAAQSKPGEHRFVEKGNWATYITYNVSDGTSAAPKMFPLYAGQRNLVGNLYVYDSGDQLFVRYVVNGGLSEYHLQVVDEFDGFQDVRTFNKKTGYGSPIPGQFDYVKEYSTKTTDTGWIEVSIKGYDKDIFIAAHGVTA